MIIDDEILTFKYKDCKPIFNKLLGYGSICPNY